MQRRPYTDADRHFVRSGSAQSQQNPDPAVHVQGDRRVRAYLTTHSILTKTPMRPLCGKLIQNGHGTRERLLRIGSSRAR